MFKIKIAKKIKRVAVILAAAALLASSRHLESWSQRFPLEITI